MATRFLFDTRVLYCIRNSSRLGKRGVALLVLFTLGSGPLESGYLTQTTLARISGCDLHEVQAAVDEARWVLAYATSKETEQLTGNRERIYSLDTSKSWKSLQLQGELRCLRFASIDEHNPAILDEASQAAEKLADAAGALADKAATREPGADGESASAVNKGGRPPAHDPILLFACNEWEHGKDSTLPQVIAEYGGQRKVAKRYLPTANQLRSAICELGFDGVKQARANPAGFRKAIEDRRAKLGN